MSTWVTQLDKSAYAITECYGCDYYTVSPPKSGSVYYRVIEENGAQVDMEIRASGKIISRVFGFDDVFEDSCEHGFMVDIAHLATDIASRVNWEG